MICCHQRVYKRRQGVLWPVKATVKDTAAAAAAAAREQ